MVSRLQDIADERYARIVATGKTIPWQEMRSYLEARVAGKKVKQPRRRNWLAETIFVLALRSRREAEYTREYVPPSVSVELDGCWNWRGQGYGRSSPRNKRRSEMRKSPRSRMELELMPLAIKLVMR